MAKKSSIDIEKPTNHLQELQRKLKLADPYTIQIIIDFLTLDTFEFVKKIVKTLNKRDAVEIISYMDGSIRANESLKTFLQNNVAKKDYIDRISNEIKTF